MTATSSPGLSLMMENIGFAGMTGTPCVIVNVQHSDPSTGQPTMIAQGDMMQVRCSSQVNYAIIVLCPASVQEMYDLTVKAFNLADLYRAHLFLKRSPSAHQNFLLEHKSSNTQEKDTENFFDLCLLDPWGDLRPDECT